MKTRSSQRNHAEFLAVAEIPARPAERVGREVLTTRAAMGQAQSRAVRTPRPTLAIDLDGYLLIECLVYIGVLFVLLGVSYLALFRCISNSVALRRNAEDISKAVHIGECWRADVRSATGNIRFEETNSVEVIHIPTGRGQILYCFATNTVSRSHNGGPWSQMLTNVATSRMASERRQTVTAWYWNLELQTRRSNSRIAPLFTFMSIPEANVPK